MTFNDLLQRMVERKASDLHLIAGLPPAFRIHGELEPLEGVERFTPEGLKDFIFAALTTHQQNMFQNDPASRNELDFGYGVPGVGRFRVNVHLSRGSVCASIRALASRIPALDELGIPEAAKEFARAKRGLVLVTGPTGSGKSTTLAALVDMVNKTRRDHILTIEDPIEYIHNSQKSYVTQREVGASGDTLTFRNALKYALRQDPDVILIGEMRDYETIGIAITSAETGHLVFGTLHTSSAAQTVSRIVDVFPTDQQPQVRTQLASTLLGVVSQVLLPKKDGSGRVAACEILMANSAVRNNIRAGKVDSIYQTLQTSSAEGMQTMDQALIKLCREGKIDYEAAKPYIYEKSTHDTIKVGRR
ncbi:MAG TPA: type IV pilus twitching motility protein PilT [Acidobacteriota bacterium]|nr:type IV pilus twitching motility protein PilT [Acidobacteriota bacterium]